MVRLSDLVHTWYDLHGITLKDSKYRLSRTLAVAARLGDPPADEFTSLAWATYRKDRLQQVSRHTVNHEQRYLAAVFSELQRLGAWAGGNPLALVRQLSTDETELSFLELAQIRQLLEQCQESRNPHTYPVALLCLATGARWGEAEALSRNSLHSGKAHFHRTKSGRSRAVPISPEVERIILGAAVPGHGRLFTSCRAAFRSAYERCGFQTPGQMTHILRHSFASHFVMAGGDILTLQRILGHTDIKMTMRYSHLSRDHLVSAMRFSPLAQLGI